MCHSLCFQLCHQLHMGGCCSCFRPIWATSFSLFSCCASVFIQHCHTSILSLAPPPPRCLTQTPSRCRPEVLHSHMNGICSCFRTWIIFILSNCTTVHWIKIYCPITIDIKQPSCVSLITVVDSCIDIGLGLIACLHWEVD